MASPEDILAGSLQCLYSYSPITFSSPGEKFTHFSSGITLASPDPAPSNWNLHASSLWIASLYLANHLDDITLDSSASNSGVDVLELGAGTGLPGILFAKRNTIKASVTLSDYPDENILRTLEENVERNGISAAQARVVGHVWGQSTAALGAFDIILAADTLWNSEMHEPFCQTLSRVLRRSSAARAYLVAGLHTGRWVIRSFLERMARFGLSVERMRERGVDGHTADTGASPEREWSVERREEDEYERRKWVVWIVVKWDGVHLSTCV